MLKTVKNSQANKTAGIAVTYRAGRADKFDTCPASCELNPSGRGCAPADIDDEYLAAVLDAKPRGGFSFTYSHFSPLYWAHKLAPNKTVINYSAPNLAAAVSCIETGIPAVAVVPAEFWKNRDNKKNVQILTSGQRRETPDAVRCPAEYNKKIGCVNCGGAAGPLCARLDRAFVVLFTAHGPGKNKAASDDPGGCYAGHGHVAIHWQALSDADDDGRTDAERLREFAAELPPRSIIRHHVAGDIGRE